MLLVAGTENPFDRVPLWAEDITAARRVRHHFRDLKEGDEVLRRDRAELREMAEAQEASLKRADEILARDEIDPRLVEKVRAQVWSIPTHPKAKNWSWVPRADGVCRHKAEWLKSHFGGGTVITGWRTDGAAAGENQYHAVFAFTWRGIERVADFDGIYYTDRSPRHPFIRCDGKYAAKARKAFDRSLKYRRRDSDDLEKRIRELELREGSDRGLAYAGIWDNERSYQAGEFATFQGSLWHAEINSKGCRPGDGTMWKMAVKSGAHRNKKDRKEAEIDAAWNSHFREGNKDEAA